MVPQLSMLSNERHCEEIQVSYEVKIEAELSDNHKNLVLFLPIVIGSKPLRFKEQSINAVINPSLKKNFKMTSHSDRRYETIFKLKLKNCFISAPPSFEEALKTNFEQPIIILDGMLKISYLGEKMISIVS